MKIEIIKDKHLPMLQEFCNQCNILKYENNKSFTAMKLLWCKEQGEYLCAIDNNKIVAVAGCHPFPEVSPSAWRILFRGCELPSYDTFKGLSKSNWNSITQREMIPEFIEICDSNQLFLTTNISNEHSNGKAARNHKLMGLLAKQGILTHVDNMIIHNTDQAVWQLNIDVYNNKRNLLRNTYVE
jgi:hypothetical protein